MPIIEVNNVVKEYRLGQIEDVKQSIMNVLGRLRGRTVSSLQRFNALDGVDFRVERGEVVGIIGTNGAGKSTLLKLLARVTVPTKGEVNVRGSVAPLIEVWAGLHPELTGRENIYLNAAIMGMPTAAIRKNFDAIVEFAEIKEFIDTPVKRYSTGMTVRLGFSIATAVDADILIVDEVLAVGDLAFQRKCFDRMEEIIKRKRKTVLIVSHNIRQVERICTRAILLNHGKILMDGDPKDVCNLFYNRSNEKIFNTVSSSGGGKGSVMSSGEIEVREINIFNDSDIEATDSIEIHNSMRVAIQFEAKCDLALPEIIVGVHTTDFVYVAVASSLAASCSRDFARGIHHIECRLDNVPFRPGSYGVMVGFLDNFSRSMWYGENLKHFKVTGNSIDMTTLPSLGLVELPFEWNLDGSRSMPVSSSGKS